MKFFTQEKPISDLKNHVTNGVEMDEQTTTLLKILALGNRDIEQGRFRDVEEVFNELDGGSSGEELSF